VVSMDKADTAEALSKAAKLQAIDSEVERIAAELREYGVETKLGVRGGLLGHDDQVQIEMYRKTFERIMQEIKGLSFTFLEKGVPDKRDAPSSTIGKLARRGSTYFSSPNILAWNLIRPGDQAQLYVFLKYGTSATFCVCEESALMKKDPSSLAVKQIWPAIGYFSSKEVESMKTNIEAEIESPSK